MRNTVLRAVACVVVALTVNVSGAERIAITIESTADGASQKCYLVLPDDFDPEGPAVPLLVSLHTWSANVEQRRPELEQLAAAEGWICLLPDFRGRNDYPEACGSQLAQQDILDAVAHVRSKYPIDQQRIYLTGVSGGGHMTMLMVARYPEMWAAASAWVGISDLGAWYTNHAADGYGEMMRQVTGGALGSSPAVDREFRHRSPLTWLHRATSVPLDIAAGVHDGHKGSVPVRHSLEAFNAIARATGAPAVTEAEIRQISRPEGRLEKPRSGDVLHDPDFGRQIYLRRRAGLSRVSIFEGGHEGIDTAAIAWLKKHVRSSTRKAAMPQWIRQVERRKVMRTTFRLEEPIHRADLVLLADFCAAEVLIDDQRVFAAHEFCPRVERSLPLRLDAGEHTMYMRFRETLGPSAVAMRMSLIGKRGVTHVVTSDRWDGADANGSPSPVLLGSPARVRVSRFDDYEQWRDAPTSEDADDMPRFRLAPGFEVERIRRARPDEGSWVSLAVDDDGRFLIAREDKGILRMTLADDGRSVSQVETINDSLLECRGLALRGAHLFVNANNSKGLYRFRYDPDAHELTDQVLLREFPGNVGHGRNDLAFSSNGLLHSIHGDAVRLPTVEIQDRTSPYRAARKGKRSLEGALVRATTDGTAWTLLSAGLRNPFGVAFHPEHNEPFTYDADAEFDMGSPWYRPTRVVHLVSGADYGWRGVTGQWPPYYPDRADNAVAVCDIGKGSPTAVKFGSRSNFPDRYRSALFILDWAYGRIVAVHLDGHGAGYRAVTETFARGQPLNVTDLDFGPDGAMYVVTGGRKTQSGLYRIRYTGPAVSMPPREQQTLDRDQWSRKSRAERTRIEQYHRPDPKAVDEVWWWLRVADPVLRHAARIALEHQPIEQWRDRALAEPGRMSAYTALLALARSGDQSAAVPILTRLNELGHRSQSASETMTAVRVYELCLAMPDVPRELRDECRRKLSAMLQPDEPATAFPSGWPASVNFSLSQLLVSLDDPQAPRRLMAQARRSDDPKVRLQYLYALRAARVGWTDELRHEWFLALNDAQSYVGGRGLPGFLDSIRNDAREALTAGQRQRLADVIAPPKTTASVPLPERPHVREWKYDELAAGLQSALESRDFEKGRSMFRAALCDRCHRVGVVGRAIGPDLTAVGGRFSAHDILRSVIDPSAVVAEPYRAVDIVMSSGRKISGQIVPGGDYRSRTLRIIPDPLRPDKSIEIEKQEIEEHHESGTSPMPAGLLNTLSRDEILDLFAFLISGGDASHRLFSKE